MYEAQQELRIEAEQLSYLYRIRREPIPVVNTDRVRWLGLYRYLHITCPCRITVVVVDTSFTVRVFHVCRSRDAQLRHDKTSSTGERLITWLDALITRGCSIVQPCLRAYLAAQVLMRDSDTSTRRHHVHYMVSVAAARAAAMYVSPLLIYHGDLAWTQEAKPVAT